MCSERYRPTQLATSLPTLVYVPPTGSLLSVIDGVDVRGMAAPSSIQESSALAEHGDKAWGELDGDVEVLVVAWRRAQYGHHGSAMLLAVAASTPSRYTTRANIALDRSLRLRSSALAFPCSRDGCSSTGSATSPGCVVMTLGAAGLSGCLERAFEPAAQRVFGGRSDLARQFVLSSHEHQCRYALKRESPGERRSVVHVDLDELDPAPQSRASVSSAGLTMRQGPHHGAHKSTSTGTDDVSTISAKVSSPPSVIHGSGAPQWPQRGVPLVATDGTRFLRPHVGHATMLTDLAFTGIRWPPGLIAWR